MASFSEAPPGDKKAGEKIFKVKCAQCHTVEQFAGHKQACWFDYSGHTIGLALRLLRCLRRKRRLLLKKAASGVEKEEFTKNKRASIHCSKRKRLYEQQIEQLGNFHLRIHDQRMREEIGEQLRDREELDESKDDVAAARSMLKHGDWDVIVAIGGGLLISKLTTRGKLWRRGCPFF